MSTATDYVDALRTTLADAADAWEEAARFWEDSARQLRERGPRSRGGHRRGDCGCGHDHGSRGHADCGCGHDYGSRESDCGCGHDHGSRESDSDCGGAAPDCCRDACRCCVPEADVVLHTRVGESRIIPFRLANSWRRPREVALAVGDWQLCEGEPAQVRAVFDVEPTLTLEPCSEQVVRLVVAARGAQDPDKISDSTTTDRKNLLRQERLPDIEACTSLYADVRFEGCSRPQRVAVVIHPARCVAIALDCGCGCCG